MANSAPPSTPLSGSKDHDSSPAPLGGETAARRSAMLASPCNYPPGVRCVLLADQRLPNRAVIERMLAVSKAYFASEPAQSNLEGF